MPPVRTLRGGISISLMVFAATLLAPIDAYSQNLGTGDVSGTITDNLGVAVPNATLSLTMGGTAVVVVQGEINGHFALRGLSPGSYELLVEQVGYQPVRISRIPVAAGGLLRMKVRLERRPPPITGVEERVYVGTGSTVAGGAKTGGELDFLARRPAATDLGQDFPGLIGTGDAREGLALTAFGALPANSMLLVDGVEEALLRHPGMPGEPASAPIFGRRSISQALAPSFSLDPEWPAARGAELSMLSANGIGHEGFSPWLSWSGASLGGAQEDNPADSSGSVVIAGASLGGGSQSGASWALDASYENRREPGAAPFALGGVELSDAISQAAGATDVSAWTSPVVHTWKGFRGNGTAVLPVGEKSQLAVRFGVASWDEDAPLLAQPVNGARSTLKASDFSGALAFTTGGESWQSTTRAGLRNGSRDWLGDALPYTGLISTGLGLGIAPSLPGSFSDQMLQLVEVVTIPHGSHSIKVGGSVSKRSLNYDWLIDGAGRAEFGSLEDFAAGQGSWVKAADSRAAPDFSVTEFAAFAQDIWQLSPAFSLTAGLRYQGQKLPTDEFTRPSELLFSRLGLLNSFVPTRYEGAAGPRAGLRWDAGGQGNTVVAASGGLVPGRYDLAAFAEVIRYDGGVTIQRGVGTIGWPNPDAASLSESQGYSFFGQDTRAPKTAVFAGSIRQVVGAGAVLTISGGYHHTDYLLRRLDYNRPAAPLAIDTDGREIWGSLEQLGGLIVATPGSNRRFADLDHVWGMRPTGYVDHYEVSVGIEGATSGGLFYAANYTLGKTEDNLVGQLSANPVDRALPIGIGEDGEDWSEGRSDLDIPGSARVAISYHLPGSHGVSLGARWRWRSGLPFTPGYRRGVDVNGDGSGANDPVAIGSMPGLSGLLSGAGCTVDGNGFAERNSCRAKAVHALDLHAGIRLPVAGRRVLLTLDAFNVVSSDVGLIDNAAVLVDPEGSITSNGESQITIPLMLNENFGELLARRNDPRTIRFGLRVEN